MQDAFHAALRRQVEKQISESSEYLAHGSASSFDDYRYRVGAIHGMRSVLELAAEVEKKLYAPNPLHNAGDD